MTKKSKTPKVAKLSRTLDPKIASHLGANLRVDPSTLRGVELRPPDASGKGSGHSSVSPSEPIVLGTVGDVTLDFEATLDASGACTGLVLAAIDGSRPEGELAGDLRGRTLIYRAGDRNEARAYFLGVPAPVIASSSDTTDTVSHDGKRALVCANCDGGSRRLEIEADPGETGGSTGGTATVIIFQTEPTTDDEHPHIER